MISSICKHINTNPHIAIRTTLPYLDIQSPFNFSIRFRLTINQERTWAFPWFIVPITYHRSLAFHHPIKIDPPCCVGDNVTLMFLPDTRGLLPNKLLESDYSSREKVHQIADVALYMFPFKLGSSGIRDARP